MNPRELLPDVLKSLDSTATVLENLIKDTASSFTDAAGYTVATMQQQTSAPVAPTTPAITTTATAPAPSPAPTKVATQTQVKKGRDRTDWSANITASLSLKGACKKITTPEPTPVEIAYSFATSGTAPVKQKEIIIDVCKEMEALEIKIKNADDAALIESYHIQKIELVKDQIIEHAARRADLFFYLLIAVYGQYVVAEKIETTKQHGKGSDPRGTAACHSSLFPGIKFKDIPSSTIPFYDKLYIKPRKSELLAGTYFLEVLNATVELPKLVNDFDGHIEGRSQPTTYVNDCLNIINRVAMNYIGPIQGMNEYYKIMSDYFSYFNRKYINTNVKARLANWRAHEKIWEYEKKGTFSGANEDLTIKRKYLQMILKMNSLLNQMPYGHYFRIIQGEILGAKYEPEQTPHGIKKAAH